MKHRYAEIETRPRCYRAGRFDCRNAQQIFPVYGMRKNRVALKEACRQNTCMNDYRRIAAIIRFLDEHHAEQPDLAAVAEFAGMSPFHMHRLFSAWAAITPKDFLQCLTLSHARNLLAQGNSVLDAALASGLSGPGRLHDLCVNLESASPGELKSGGAGWTINAGFAESPFGRCLIAESPRGICHLAFVGSADGGAEWGAVQQHWPQANLQRDDLIAERLAEMVFTPPARLPLRATLRAFVKGTAFQVRVWRALLQIEPGTLAGYGRLAALLDKPGAARAVGAAVGRNPLAYLIPCHRVIRETGVIGGYRWGTVRKRAMIAWESAAHYAGVESFDDWQKPAKTGHSKTDDNFA